MVEQLDIFAAPDWILDHFTQAEWDAFNEWRATPAGQEISSQFLKFTKQVKNRGYKTFSAEAVVNHIRWEQSLEHGPDVEGFKINNNWKPYLARWAMMQSQDLQGFFCFRNKERERGPGYG